jgi:hypothetical protein
LQPILTKGSVIKSVITNGSIKAMSVVKLTYAHVVGKHLKEINTLSKRPAQVNAPTCYRQVIGLKTLSEERATVYDLTVENESNYFANGILVHNCDPTTCIAAYEYNGQRIYDELIYQTGLLNGDIAALLKSNGISKQDKGYADCADPKSIDEINRYGFNLKPVTKGADSIAFGISIMQGQPFQVTKRSANIKKELNAYCWDTDKDGNTINKPIDAHNHAIDAMRYVEMMLTIKPSFKPFRAIQF